LPSRRGGWPRTGGARPRPETTWIGPGRQSATAIVAMPSNPSEERRVPDLEALAGEGASPRRVASRASSRARPHCRGARSPAASSPGAGRRPADGVAGEPLSLDLRGLQRLLAHGLGLDESLCRNPSASSRPSSFPRRTSSRHGRQDGRCVPAEAGQSGLGSAKSTLTTRPSGSRTADRAGRDTG